MVDNGICYLDGQVTVHDSTIFTGYRWENRFRPLLREHWINPVIYVEFENTSADKALRESGGPRRPKPSLSRAQLRGPTG